MDLTVYGSEASSFYQLNHLYLQILNGEFTETIYLFAKMHLFYNT